MGGNTQSLPRFTWEFIRSDDWHEVYKNDKGDLAEKHTIENDPRLNEEEELDIYYYRYTSTKPIVKVYRAQYDSSSDFCSNHRNITVFTEYIPFRLIDIQLLSHEQGLYTLSQTLYGFHELFVKLGPFSVDDTMIGFNHEGHVKVWYNPQFAKNHFQVQGIVLMSTANPKDFDQRMSQSQHTSMVLDIWDSIHTKAAFHADFTNKIQSVGYLTFYNMKQMVDEQIKKCPYVPNKLNFMDKHGIISSSQVVFKDNIRKWRNKNGSGNMETPKKMI